jgi:hypothetical protein
METIRPSRMDTVTFRIGCDRSGETTVAFSIRSSRAITGPQYKPCKPSSSASLIKWSARSKRAGL